MNPDAEKAKKSCLSMLEEKGYDTDDPKVQSCLDDQLEELSEWLDDKPDFVQTKNIEPTIKERGA